MKATLSNFQEKQIDGLLEVKENNLERILRDNVDHANFPFCYITENAEKFTTAERVIFSYAIKKSIKNILEIDIPVEQKSIFIPKLEDTLIIVGEAKL